MFNNSIKFGNNLTIAIIILLFLTLFTSNPFLSFFALAILIICAKLIWKQNDSPLLIMAIFMQWLQISIKIFYADFLKQDIKQVHEYTINIESTIIISLLGIFVLSLGISRITKSLKIPSVDLVKSYLGNYDAKRTLFLYVASIIVSFILLKYAFVFTGLQQFIVKFLEFKWSIFFVLFLLVFSKNRLKKPFFVILTVEVILSFTGFFSNFKDFFFILIISFIYLKQKLSAKELAIIFIAFFVVFNLMVFWQNIKGNYRNFLSGGEKTQQVVVETSDALGELSTLVTDVDIDSYDDGFEKLINRASYVDFFSAAQEWVPAKIPHENGKLWFNALTHTFMPRFFFQNKAVIDDSEKTRKYTGLDVSGAEQGTSISLGYMAETYVDFGKYLMFIPLFLLGLTIGYIYKYILTKSYNYLWGHALNMPLFFQLSAFETALEKVIGGLIAYFLVYLILRKFFIKTTHLYLTKNN